MPKFNYWEECILEAFSEAEIHATPEQINIVISAVEGGHENFSMAHGHDCIPNPLRVENERLEKEIRRERDKIICKECNGKGHYMTYGGTFQSEHTCPKCRGEGRHDP
jgi:hypothetical protein